MAADATEEQQAEAAKKIADKFFVPGKPASFRAAAGPEFFQKELYRLSRINYSK